jgi:hypothetical protein
LFNTKIVKKNELYNTFNKIILSLTCVKNVKMLGNLREIYYFCGVKKYIKKGVVLFSTTPTNKQNLKTMKN